MCNTSFAVAYLMLKYKAGAYYRTFESMYPYFAFLEEFVFAVQVVPNI